MKRSAALAVLAVALSSAGAAAQSPYYDAWRDTELELGARYLYGQPNFRAKVKDFDRTPISRLDFSNGMSNGGELFARLNHKRYDLFLRGTIGFGYNMGGKLIDDDYFGGRTISSTTSKLSPSFITDATVDIGWAPEVLPEYGLRFGPFAGFLYKNDVFTAKGLRCNNDDFGGQFCGTAPDGTASYAGEQVLGTNQKVIKNDVRWMLPRIGLEASMPIMNTVLLRVEGSYLVPGLESYRNEDSHYLRTTELGALPNFVDTSTHASGFTLQGSVDYRLTEQTSIGVGVRRIVLDSGNAKAIAGAQLPAADQSVSRAGGVYQTTQGFLQLKVSY